MRGGDGDEECAFSVRACVCEREGKRYWGRVCSLELGRFDAGIVWALKSLGV
jgi:hypothetical protein